MAADLRARAGLRLGGGRWLVTPWSAPALLGCAVVLVPWTALLFATLPRHYVANHWAIAWGGFDIGLGVALASTAVMVIRRSPLAEVTATITGSLLCCDAWFDVLTRVEPQTSPKQPPPHSSSSCRSLRSASGWRAISPTRSRSLVPSCKQSDSQSATTSSCHQPSRRSPASMLLGRRSEGPVARGSEACVRRPFRPAAWSIYGAERAQSAAPGRKWLTSEDGSNTPTRNR